MTLVAQLPEIERHGTPDMAFAVIGLMARTQTKQGNAIMALSSLDSLRTEFEEDNKRFLPNIDAMRCRIWLRTGEMEKAEQCTVHLPPRSRRASVPCGATSI